MRVLFKFAILVALLAGLYPLAAEARSMAMAPAIIGSTWTAIEISGEVPPTDRSTFKITEEMKAAGSGGCNSWFAPIVIESNTIRIGSIVSTRKACPDTMKQEAAYFAALAAARMWEATEGELRFFDQTGKLVLRFAI